MTDAQLRRRIRAIKRTDKMQDFVVVCAICMRSARLCGGRVANSSSTAMLDTGRVLFAGPERG